MLHLLIAMIGAYLVVHLMFSRHHYRRNSHLPWHKRIWISVPGPFRTRVSRRL